MVTFYSVMLPNPKKLLSNVNGLEEHFQTNPNTESKKTSIGLAEYSFNQLDSFLKEMCLPKFVLLLALVVVPPLLWV